MKITEPGIYRNFPTAAYFADPTPSPSFTQSLAKVLIEQSPFHAYQAHPRLNVKPADEDDGEVEKYVKAQAIGNAAHSLMLCRGKALAVGEFDSWRGKDAGNFRANAIAGKMEPILRKHYDMADAMVGKARDQLDKIAGCERAFLVGDAEVVIASCEDGLWLRSMVDWITPDLLEVWDYKTIGGSASPYVMGKKMFVDGWHIQAAMHERIMNAIDPANAGRRRYRYVAQEQDDPHALTVCEVGEAALTIGRKQIGYAIDIWRACTEAGAWPSYPPRIIRPELPGWAEQSWLERELAEDEDPIFVPQKKIIPLMAG